MFCPLFWTFLIVVSLLLFWYMRRRRQMSLLQRNGIPGPQPHIFYGNLLEVFTKGTDRCYREWAQQFGPIAGFYFGAIPLIVVSDIDLLKQIQVKDFHLFKNRTNIVEGFIHPSFMGSLPLVKNDQWSKQRNQLVHALNPSKMKTLVPCLLQRIDHFVVTLKVKSQDGRKEIDLCPYYLNLLLDMTFASTLGIDSFAGNKEINFPSIDYPQRNISMLSIFAQGFTVMFPEVASVWLPVRKHLITLMDNLTTFSVEGTFYKAVKAIVRCRRGASPGMSGDIVQWMLKSTSSPTNATQSKESPAPVSVETKAMSAEEVASNWNFFLMVGSEGTSHGLSMITHQLVNHPQIQEQLRQEVQQLVDTEGKLGYNAFSGLPLMEAVINETFRLNAPAFGVVSRVSSTDYRYKDLTIPKGAEVVAGVNQIHRNPLLWSQPDVFDPQRFYGSNKRTIDPIAFQPFGAGPRYCIGQRMTYLQLKLILAKLLLEFSFEPGPNTEQEDLSLEKVLGFAKVSKGLHVILLPLH